MFKKCTPLWREAHFELKMFKQTPQCRTTFGRRAVQKVHAIVARSTFRSRNAKNTTCSDHFWTFKGHFSCHGITITTTATTTNHKYNYKLQLHLQLHLQRQLPYTRLHRTTTTTTFTTTTTTTTTTTLHLQLHLQLPLHYTYNYTYRYTGNYTYNFNCNYIRKRQVDRQRERQRDKGRERERLRASATFRSISVLSLPAIHHNNSPLLSFPMFETSATALRGTAGISVSVSAFFVRVLI